MARGVYSFSNYFALSSALATAEPLTIAGWVYPNAFTNYVILSGIYYVPGSGSGLEGFEIFLDITTGKTIASVNTGAGSTDAYSATGATVNTWNHFAGLFTSSTSRTAYMNGAPGTTLTTSRVFPDTLNKTVIGIRNNKDNSIAYPAAYNWIAELGFWNAALTTAEILQLSLGYSPLFVRSASLVDYYSMIRGDASGNEPGYRAGLKMVEQGTVAVQTHPRVFYPSSPIKLGVPAAGGPVELVVQDAAHAHAADNVALLQAHLLAVADASHAHTADAVALVQAHLLALQDVTHAHAVDNVALIQAHLLAVADISHAHTADNVALLQAYLLAVQDSTHIHTADNIALIQAYLLAVQDSSHVHTAENLDLLQAYFLTVQDATHEHTAENVDLLQAYNLTVADASHAHTADNVTLSLAALLEVQDATHVHSVDNPDLIQAHLLAVADALHTHTAENVDLIQGFVLTVADATHGHTADNVDISSSILLIVADVLHAHDVESPALLQAYVLTVADALHAHVSDNVDLLQAYVLAVQDSMHVHTADNISLTSLGVPGLATLLDVARTAVGLTDAQVGNVVILDDAE